MNDEVQRLRSALPDRYVIERELGRGGMATVYLAFDEKQKRKVAIKVLRPELAATLGVQRFLREIELTAQLVHPHILPLLESGKAEEILYYVMPYVEGETLRDRLKREGQLPIEDAIQTTCEVAEALAYAHSQGVIHRDVKPENIFLAAGQAVIGDFGIARALSEAGGERLTETGLAMGTPAYMSPEQAMGRDAVDHRTDIYALGCVIYEMLGGDPPFKSDVKRNEHYMWLGLAYAGLGRFPEAIEAGEESMQLLPVARDEFDGPLVMKFLAVIYAKAGEYDKAVETLEYLMTIPSAVSVERIAVDPQWAPYRELPEFVRFLETVP
jgi:serine/threonine protein kinase